jgi:N-acetylglucosamine-6-phosphate deacetylase
MKPESILFSHVNLVGTEKPSADGWLLVKRNQITNFGIGEPPQEIQGSSDKTINGNNSRLLPGYIDIHTHGAVGVDFVGADEDGLQKVSQFFASHGVTSFLVTTWAASETEIRRTIEAVKSVIGKENGASIVGIHLEGPFINPTRAGAQSPKDIRPAERSEVAAYFDSGLIRVVTLAPEVPENQWLITECASRGITTSAGHTDATYAEMQTAAMLGIRQMTHTFNGMRGFTHREPGAVGAAMEIRELSCELIADKIHVHPAAIRLLVNVKGLEKVILVTDSISGTGMPDGEFYIQGQRVRYSNNEARLKNGTLAGSMLTMDQALINLVGVTGRSIEDCWVCSSKNPARSIGLANRKGDIRLGMDADLILLASNLQPILTMVQGRIVYEENSTS